MFFQWDRFPKRKKSEKKKNKHRNQNYQLKTMEYHTVYVILFVLCHFFWVYLLCFVATPFKNQAKTQTKKKRKTKKKKIDRNAKRWGCLPNACFWKFILYGCGSVSSDCCFWGQILCVWCVFVVYKQKSKKKKNFFFVTFHEILQRSSKHQTQIKQAKKMCYRFLK